MEALQAQLVLYFPITTGPLIVNARQLLQIEPITVWAESGLF